MLLGVAGIVQWIVCTFSTTVLGVSHCWSVRRLETHSGCCRLSCCLNREDMLLRDRMDEVRRLLGSSEFSLLASSSFLPLQLSFDSSEAVGGFVETARWKVERILQGQTLGKQMM